MDNAVIVRNQDALISHSFSDTMHLAKIFVESGIFKDTKDVANAIVKILAGAELGIPPVASMRGVHVVEGRVELSAGLMAALIKRSERFDYRDTGSNDTCAGIEFSENGRAIGVSTFSMDDAKRAGLADRQTWRRYPAAMLWARALSQGARRYCPSIFVGPVYAHGEISGDSSLAYEDAPQAPWMPEDDVSYEEDPGLARRRFWAQLRPAMTEAGWSESDLRDFMREAFGKESTKELTSDERARILDAVSVFEKPSVPNLRERWGWVISSLADAGLTDVEAYILSVYDADSLDDLQESSLETYEEVVRNPDMVTQMGQAIEKWKEKNESVG